MILRQHRDAPLTETLGWLQGTFGNGIRTTASTACILPFLERGNFDVLINTTVTRFTQTGQERGIPVFRGVQFARYPNCASLVLLAHSLTSTNSYSLLSAPAPVFSLNATAEIIVSAGAINTPQLLALARLPRSPNILYLSLLTFPQLAQTLWIIHNCRTSTVWPVRRTISLKPLCATLR